MEVVQGKSTDKKIVVAQEIAFAKVLAGNNKTLRDRAVKKLRKWMTIRGSGKWEFTEEEFMRIWTGLFYCMWMSDKFLIQEELAESISKLIHCFKKNSNIALLFIKCFNKRILLDWEGLDQYRIDKFNMLIRRFLRQTFLYCNEKNWEESLLNKLTDIFYNVVLHRDNALGFVLHFISIYPEELAKVTQGKLESKTILRLIEPFVKLIARTNDARIRKETEDFFMYLMRQTDKGIEFEEKFNAWKEQGFPGEGPHCMSSVEETNENDEDMPLENGNDAFGEEEDKDDDLESESPILDPRAGSVHVDLPQIPIDVEGFINLFEKYQNAKQTNAKGRKLLKCLVQKFETLKKGKFPAKIKKSPILMEKRKKKQAVKNAKKLLEFTYQLENEPIKSEEFKDVIKELEEGSDIEDENLDEEKEFDDEEQPQLNLKNKNKTLKVKNKKTSNKIKKENSINNVEKFVNTKKKKIKKLQNGTSDEGTNQRKNLEKRKKKMKPGKVKQEGKSTQQIIANQCIVVTPKKKLVKEVKTEKPGNSKKMAEKVMPATKTGMKRKILSSWQVQELDTSSPEYYKIETPKVITIEKKIEESGFLKENEPQIAATEKKDSEENGKISPKIQKQDFVPIFWEKAKAKAIGKNKTKNKVFVNPFAKNHDDSETSNRRISFALDRNMAQENEQYLEEVKNSPRVPFDGSKKPIQSALKSGLAPSPVNPFYRFKKIKLQNT